MTILETYKALADESRLRLIAILSQGFFSVQELTETLGLGQSTISHHLKILNQVGITRVHKDGTWAYYTLQEPQDGSVSTLLVQNFLTLRESIRTTGLEKLLSDDSSKITTLLDRRRSRGQRYFEEVAKQWRNIRTEAQGSESFLDLVSGLIPPNTTLLELGCGSGALLDHILPRSGKTIAVDYSQAMLDEASASLGKRADDVDLRLGYLEHLPLGDSSVDTAVAYMVLHHIPNPLDALMDAARVLKTGGTLLIVDLVKHDNEQMKEKFADLWLGFEPALVAQWAQEAGLISVKVELLGSAQEVFLLTCNKKEEK